MAELVIVHKAIAPKVSQVIACLENHGLHPLVLDNVEKMGPYRGLTHEIRIAVPEPEHDLAVRILAQRERRNELCLLPVVRRTNVIVFLLIVALSLLAIVVLFDARGLWFAAIGTLLTVIAAFALIRWAWRKEPDTSSAQEESCRGTSADTILTESSKSKVTR